MTIPVERQDLAAAMAERGFGYVITVGDDGHPHAVATRPVWQDGALLVEAGRRTSANLAARPAVSVVFPPPEEGGYSLIVDADAVPDRAGWARLAPVRAMLHRPAPVPGPLPEGACGHDCVPLPTEPA